MVNIFVTIIKKVPGKMKDEYAGRPIYEYIGIKPKMYSVRNVYNYEKSVYKGHSSDIKYDQFKDTHSNKRVIKHNTRGIKSKKHEIYTYESNKTSLSCYDDKKDIFLMKE